MSSPEFVFDRTQSDVDRAVFLNDLKWSNMSLLEQTEYLTGLKGSYTYKDLNRVENAVQEIANMLIGLGYSVSVSTRSWAIPDIPSEIDMTRYLNNIQTLRNTIQVAPNTPGVPASMSYLNYETANDIERILFNITVTIAGITAPTRFSGTFYSAQEGLR